MDDFLREVFGEDNETNPCIIRNPGCRFSEMVLDYILLEWEVEPTQYPHTIQNKIMDAIDLAKKDGMNVPNTAAKISMEILPL
jgi:hypothetical protein